MDISTIAVNGSAVSCLRNRRPDGSLKKAHEHAALLARCDGRLDELADLLIPLLPYRCVVGGGFKNGKPASWVESIRYAVERDYIGLNSETHINAIVRDVDHDDIDRWRSCGLPSPTWICQTPTTGRYHIVWLLARPVYRGPGAHLEPQRFLARVQEALDHELDADSGFAGVLTKNPFSPKWQTRHLDGKPVKLHDLYDAVSCAPAAPRRRQRSVEGSGLGRNCDLFDGLRHWAYDHVSRCRDRQAWDRAVAEQAAALNRFTVPLDAKELAGITRSVAKWVWERYEGAQDRRDIDRGVMRLDDLDIPLVAKQRMAAKRSSTINARSSDRAIEEAVERLQADRVTVTQAAVAKASGLSVRTVKSRWPFVLGMVQNGVYQVIPPVGGEMAAEKGDRSQASDLGVQEVHGVQDGDTAADQEIPAAVDPDVVVPLVRLNPPPFPDLKRLSAIRAHNSRLEGPTTAKGREEAYRHWQYAAGRR